jgi:hypothetical protein
MAAQELLDGEADVLTRKVIELAKDGDRHALRLCLERIIPVRRNRAIQLSLPPVNGVGDLPKVVLSISAATASGTMTPAEAADLVTVFEAYRQATETADLAERVRRLEEDHNDAEKESSAP